MKQQKSLAQKISNTLDSYTLNFGPQHPSAHGVLRLLITANGERITQADPHIGLLHRGTEKLLEMKTFAQGLPYMDRLDYVSMLNQEHIYAALIERARGDIFISKRARFLRAIFDEVTRLLNHLMSVTTHALDVGALTPFLWAFEEREKLMEIYERASGARMHANYVRPGGLAQDIPVGVLDSIYKIIKEFVSRVDEIEDMLTNNRIWKARLQGIGVARPQVSWDWGFSGVMARASGMLWDLRKVTPYASYDETEFKVPVGVWGDCYDRFMIRIQEFRESCRFLLGAINNIPTGEVMAPDFRAVKPSRSLMKNSIQSMIRHFKLVSSGLELPESLLFVSGEAPKGEFGLFISCKDGAQSPERMKIRAPGFYHLQAIKILVIDHMLADVVTVLGAQDIVFGEVDR